MLSVGLITTAMAAMAMAGVVYWHFTRNSRRSSGESVQLTRLPRLSLPPQLASLSRLLSLVPTLRMVSFPRFERYVDFRSSLIPISVSVSMEAVVSRINEAIGYSNSTARIQSEMQLELDANARDLAKATRKIEELKIQFANYFEHADSYIARADGYIASVEEFVRRVDRLETEVTSVQEKRDQQVQEVKERFDRYKEQSAKTQEVFNRVTMKVEELLDTLDDTFGQPEEECSEIGECESETYLERRDRVIERLVRKNKQLEKLADVRLALNEEFNKPEVRKCLEAMTWILRRRAKLVGKIAQTFENKLESLPEDMKEIAVKVIEYSKTFYTVIPLNEIDEKLSNYYSDVELEQYRCPITLEVMVEPVKIADREGHAYYFERLALQRYYDEAVMETGNFSLPTRPDIALIAPPKDYPIDEEMQSRIQELLQKAEPGSKLDVIDAVIGSSDRAYVNHYGMGREDKVKPENGDDLDDRRSPSV